MWGSSTSRLIPFPDGGTHNSLLDAVKHANLMIQRWRDDH